MGARAPVAGVQGRGEAGVTGEAHIAHPCVIPHEIRSHSPLPSVLASSTKITSTSVGGVQHGASAPARRMAGSPPR
jgi:hypothetical protein